MTTLPDDPDLARWTVESRDILQDCRVFRVLRQHARREPPPAPEEIESGRRARSDFYVLDAPNWVNVVALTDDDDLVLIEQWRQGIEGYTLEIPGGMADGDESPREAGERELLEETGYRAREWRELGSIEPNPAIQNNRCYTYLALGAESSEKPQFDSTEECRVVLRPYADAPELVASGAITHALVVVGLHFEALRRAGQLSV